MPELFSQKLRANFTPEQQDYYLQLENEIKELLNGQTQEEVLAGGDPEIIQKILKIKQEMLNFVLTKKTREMVRQEETERDERLWRKREEQLEKERRAVDLNEIMRKHRLKEDLTDIELKFLYCIEGFGLPYYADIDLKTKVENIIFKRNIKKDVARILDCDEEQISLTKEEYLEGVDIMYHFGSLDFTELTAWDEGQLPRYIGGSLNLRNLKVLEDIVFPESIGGDLNLFNVTDVVGEIKLPAYVGGSLHLLNLEMIGQLKLPNYIGGWLDLRGLKTAKGLKLPKSIDMGVTFSDLTNIDDLEIPIGVTKVVFDKISDIELEKLMIKFPHVEFTTSKL